MVLWICVGSSPDRLSSVRISHLSKVLKDQLWIPCSLKETKTKHADFWPVTLEELPNIPQVTVWRRQVIEWTCTDQRRTDLNRSSHRCLPAAAAAMYKSYCVLSDSETGTCMTLMCIMLTPQDFLPWLAVKVEVYTLFTMPVFTCCFFMPFLSKEAEDGETDDLSSSLLSSDRLQDAFQSSKAAGV